MCRGGGPPPGESVDVAELAVAEAPTRSVADVFGEIGAALQQHRAFVVVAADRVHQGRSELEAGNYAKSWSSRERSASFAARRRHSRPASTAPAAIAARPDSSSEAATARVDTPCGASMRWRRVASRSAGVGSAPSSVRNNASVSSTWVRGGGVATGGDEALDEQHVRTLVEDRSSHANLSQFDRTVGVTCRQRADRLAADLSVDQAGDALAVHQQPGVELRTTSSIDPVEEFAFAGDVERAGPQRLDVDPSV